MGKIEDDKKTLREHAREALDKKTARRRMRKAETATIRHARRFIGKRFSNVVEVRREIMIWLTGIVVLIGAVGLQQMWFRSSYSQMAPIGGGTYAEADLGPITTLNPLYVKTPAEISTTRLVFASLFSYDKTGAINRDLADSVAISSDGRSYTVKLKPGALWHDGRELTSEDVAFTVGLIKNPATRSVLRAQWQDVTIKVVDERTIVFTLPGPYAAFLHALTFAILPKHVLEDVSPAQLKENSYSLNPIGAGPFAVKLVQAAGEGHSIANLEAFENYVNGAPKLSRFEVHAFDNQDGIITALKTGQVTATAALDESSEIEKLEQYVIQKEPVDAGTYAFFNTSHPLLKDVALRRALRSAIDIATLRQEIGNEKFPLDLPFTPGQLSSSGVPKVGGYNPTSAASSLDSLGWKLDGKVRKKDGQPLSLVVTTLKGTVYEKAAKLIAKDWEKLGVKVTITSIDPEDSRQDFTQNIIQPRAYDVLVYELAIGADLDVYAFWHSSQTGPRGLNLSVYSNPISDATLTSARARLEPDLREIKYKAFAGQWLEDVPAVGLFQSSILYISNKQTTNIEDGQHLVSAYDRYANILYWTAEKSSVYKTP